MRHGPRYFVTITNDFSWYGYVYLIRHSFEIFEVTRTLKNKVENQLCRKIKIRIPDKGGEYLSQEFSNPLRNYIIIS